MTREEAIADAVNYCGPHGPRADLVSRVVISRSHDGYEWYFSGGRRGMVEITEYDREVPVSQQDINEALAIAAGDKA